MSYRIEVTEVTERGVVRKNWNKMHDDPARTGQYAYVEVEGVEKVERQILKLEAEKVDVNAVIKAVVGL
jgi:hypothetical protein